VSQIGMTLFAFGAAQGRIDVRCCNAARGQGIDLIFHQRNQRRDHHCEAVELLRRNLIAQRFAHAGRHHHQRVFALQDVIDDDFLQTAKISVAKIFLQKIVNGHEWTI
jgi:hypothetical protein